MRLFRVEARVNYVPGSPDYVYTDKLVQVETTILSINDDKLLWTISEAARDVVLGIAMAIGKEARKWRLVK